MNQLKIQVIETLLDHLRIVNNSLKQMLKFYSAWAKEGSSKKVKELRKEIAKLEEDADIIKSMIIKSFAEAESHGLGTLLGLVLKTDGILNHINEFTDRILYIEHKLPRELDKRIVEILKTSIDMGEALAVATKSLLDTAEKAFETSKKVHLLEHDIDSQYREFENILYDSKDIEVTSMLKIKAAVLKIEQMADLIEDIADVIRVVAYSV